MIHGRRVSFEHGFHKGHAFADRNRGQVYTISHIPDGIDRGHAGLAVFIHDDLTLASSFNAHGLKPQIVGIGRATGGVHDHVELILGAVGGCDPNLIAILGHFDHIGAQTHINAILAHFIAYQVTGFLVKAAQDLLTTIELRGFHPQPVHDPGEFAGDIATAHDQNVFGQLRQVENLVRGDGQL